MKKRKLVLVLVLALVLQMLPVGAWTGVLNTASVSEAATTKYETPPTTGSTSGDYGTIHWELTPETAQEGWLHNGVTPYKLSITGSGDMQDFDTITYQWKSSPNQSYYDESATMTDADWGWAYEKIQTISIGTGITKISNNAFYGCNSALTVEIGADVTSIGASAFAGCNCLKGLALPDGVTSIGAAAFSGCTNAETANIPDTVTSLGSSAFESCASLKEIAVPASIGKSLASSVFYGCSQLETAVIADGIEEIGDSAFYRCYNLAEITLPNTLKTIGQSAFYQAIYIREPQLADQKWVELILPDTLETIGNSAFAGCNRLTSVTLPEGVQTIGTNSFSSTGLTVFTVPASVTTIGVNPFIGGELQTIKVAQGNQNYVSENNMLIELKENENSGSDLDKVISYPCKGDPAPEVPAGVTSIGQSAFQSTEIKNVTLPGSLLEIEGNAFQNAQKLAAVDVPEKTQKIGDNAFYGCRVLEDVALSGGLLSIGTQAFRNCQKISAIRLPDKVETIGNSAFAYCTVLEEMSFPNTLKTVGASALEYCSALKRVSFGENIETIAGNVFYGCPNLAELTISEGNAYLIAEKNVVYNKEKTRLIYYAAGMEEEKYTVADTVKVIGTYAFTYCTHLQEIRFPASVTSLENAAVYYNTSIDKLLFKGEPPAVKETYSTNRDTYGNIISYDVRSASVSQNSVKGGYSDNSGLVIFYPKNLAEQWTNQNNGWTGAKQYANLTNQKWTEKFTVTDWDPEKDDIAEGEFANGLQWEYRDDIGQLRFIGEGEVPDFPADALPTWSNQEDVNHMQDIKLVDTGDTSRIGSNALNGAGKLVRILAGDKLKQIGDMAFANCENLEIVRMQGVEQIGKEAFAGAASIVDDLDVRGAKSIGDGAFKRCTGMTDILLGESLQSLGKEAFASCSALETLIVPDSLVSMGEGCFSGCSAIRTINIPKGITAVQANCFADCSNLQKVYFYGDYPALQDGCFGDSDTQHDDLTIYYRAGNSTWDAAGDNWNGIPVVGLDKFYTERQDHYSFANTYSSFGYTTKYFIPMQRYVTALQSVVRGAYYYAAAAPWGGNCFGMAASSMEFYEGNQFNVKDYTSTAENLYDVTAPGNSNADLTKLIEIYQVSQFVDEIGEEIAKNFADNSDKNADKNAAKYRKLIKQVEEFERSGGLGVDSAADPVIMCVYTACSGHALVPVAVNMDEKGNYILDVYDCNSPDGFNKLTIKKDFSGIQYGKYYMASFVKYSTIRDALTNADFSGQYLNKAPKESSNISIAVNREEVKLENSGDRDYTEIPGAYEQRRMSDGSRDAEDVFGGIRSFILPQSEGEYHIEDISTEKADSEEEDLKYYVATEDLFSEIETSDENAKLVVKSARDTGNDSVTLESEDANTESELTVMDVSGIQKEISLKGSSVTVEVNSDKYMTISVSDDTKEIKVDGETLEVGDNNKAKVSFYASGSENAMKAADMSCDLAMDVQNKLSGMAESYVTWAKEESGEVDVITSVKDREGNVIAEQTDRVRVGLGMQKVNVELNKLETNLGDLSGEFSAVCEMTVVDADGNKVSVSQPDILLRAASGQETSTPTSTPTTTPTPTVKPQGPSVNEPGIVIPTPTPTPSAIKTPEPTKTPEAAKTPEPADTPAPTQPSVVTPDPVITPEPVPTEAPDTSGKSSVPKKGKIVTAGAMKYIVVKSAKKNGTVAVYGAKKKNAAKVTIPKKVTINGYSFKVTEIHKNAFGNMKKLSEVSIGANVTKIGNSAFKNCKKLRFIIIPKKVTTIGKKAFAGCTNLNYMLVKSDKIKSVGSSAFQGITSKMTVKTSKAKWRKYATLFMNRGKMSHNALFIIDPVKLKYKGRLY